MSTPTAGGVAAAKRHVAAVALDYVAISLCCGAVAALLAKPLSRAGDWPWLFGSAIGVLSIALLQGPLGGQSPGMMLLDLRVVGENGLPLPLPRSILRSLTLFVAAVSPGRMSPIHRLDPRILVPIEGLIIAVTFALLYLLLFNRPYRRSLHDLVARSWVIDTRTPGPLPPGIPLARRHVVVLAIAAAFFALLTVVALLPALTTDGLGARRADERLAAQLGVRSIHVKDQRTSPWSLGEERTNARRIVAKVIMRNPEASTDSLAVAAARAALMRFPNAAEFEAVDVEVVRGFNLGFWDFSTWTNYSYPVVTH